MSTTAAPANHDAMSATPLKLAIVTDAWHPQTNGVVTTMNAVVDWLRGEGHTVELIEPSTFLTLPCPGYSEIRLAVNRRGVGRRLRAFQPDRVHVVTECPLGRAAMRFLRANGWQHTTSFHTRFPEYIRARLPGFPLTWGYAVLRRFHAQSSAVLVPTAQMARDLEAWGFSRLVVWSRGVDTKRFHPGALVSTQDRRPILLYVGRVACEKNLEAFLDLDVPGTKWIVGDGPDRMRLQRAYPQAVFTGRRQGRELAACYASADVFVFPSRTDTYGIVMLEAMACGTPVAAYPVTGPVDVVRPGVTGCLNDNLAAAIDGALALERAACRAQARENDWQRTARFFLEQTVPTGSSSRATAALLPAD